MQPISAGHLDDSMLNTLTCRSCKFYLNVSPIMAFDNGTSICGRCYKEGDYTDDTRPVRNKLYESISQYVPFPCKYRDVGCKERRPGNALTVHESLCLYRPCTCPVSDCGWDGFVQSLQEHYETNHPDLYIVNHAITLDTNRDFEENKFVIDNDMQFVVQVKCETSSGKLWCAAICVTSAICNASYNLELEFVYSERKTSIIFNTLISRSLQPMNQNEALQIDINLLKKMLNTTEDLKANITFTLTEKNNILVEPTLLKEFECPVCNHYMVSSVFICSNGHSLCHFCKTQMDTCPICRVRLTSVHNYALESIIEQMNYPCQYYRNGCRFIAPASEIQAHEVTCALQIETPEAVGNSSTVQEEVPATA